MFRSFAHRNEHLVKLARSNLERHADGVFLADHLPASGLAETMQREIAHIHSGNDHSVHVVLAPADCMLLNCVQSLRANISVWVLYQFRPICVSNLSSIPNSMYNQYYANGSYMTICLVYK